LTVPFFLVQRGAEHQQAGDYAAAGADFSRAVAIDPQDPQALIALGNIDLLEGNAARATTVLAQATKVVPDNRQAQRLLFRAAFDAGELDDAQQALVALRALEGPDAEPDLAGEIDLAMFHLPAAKAEFDTAASAHPAAAGPQIALARISGLQGDTMTEETKLREVLRKDPANSVAVELLVAVLASKGQIDDAAVILAQAHQDDPKNLRYIRQIVEYDLVTHRFNQAQSVLNSLDAPIEDSPEIIEEKIQIALAIGKVNEARSLLGTMIAKYPTLVTAPLTLARLNAQASDLKDAEATLDQAILVNPHDFTLMAARAEFTLKESGMSAALAEAQSWATAPTHLPEALAIPGQLYLMDNQPLKSADAFGAAYETSGSPRFLLLEIATLEGIQQSALSNQQNGLTKSKLNNTLVKVRSALSTSPRQPGLLEALAQVDIANGQFDQAQEELTKALAILPNDVDALNNLAFVEDQLHLPDAELLASRAYFLSPTPAISDTLGWILFEHKNYGSALLLLSNAYQGLPRDPDVTYHYASVLAKTGNRAKAVALLKPLAASSDQTTTTTIANALLSKLALNQ
jgi:cellulose synthase operon protein C